VNLLHDLVISVRLIFWSSGNIFFLFWVEGEEEFFVESEEFLIVFLLVFLFVVKIFYFILYI